MSNKDLLSTLKYVDAKPRTTAARKWYRELSKSPNAFATKQRYVTTPAPGEIYTFAYDPKLKRTLPYYDTFPMIMYMESYSDGFLGLNLHYVSLPHRAMLMDYFLELINNKKYDETTRAQLSYSVMKASSKNKYLKPMTKKYLFSHTRSKLMKIYPDEWGVALFLPVEQFKKESKQKVFSESNAKMR